LAALAPGAIARNPVAGHLPATPENRFPLNGRYPAIPPEKVVKVEYKHRISHSSIYIYKY